MSTCQSFNQLTFISVTKLAVNPFINRIRCWVFLFSLLLVYVFIILCTVLYHNRLWFSSIFQFLHEFNMKFMFSSLFFSLCYISQCWFCLWCFVNFSLQFFMLYLIIFTFKLNSHTHSLAMLVIKEFAINISSVASIGNTYDVITNSWRWPQFVTNFHTSCYKIKCVLKTEVHSQLIFTFLQFSLLHRQHNSLKYVSDQQNQVVCPYLLYCWFLVVGVI